MLLLVGPLKLCMAEGMQGQVVTTGPRHKAEPAGDLWDTPQLGCMQAAAAPASAAPLSPVFSRRSATTPPMTISASIIAVFMSYLGSLAKVGWMAGGRKVPSLLSPLFSHTLSWKRAFSSMYICGRTNTDVSVPVSRPATWPPALRHRLHDSPLLLDTSSCAQCSLMAAGCGWGRNSHSICSR
jgi:hypothetical protein